MEEAGHSQSSKTSSHNTQSHPLTVPPLQRGQRLALRKAGRRVRLGRLGRCCLAGGSTPLWVGLVLFPACSSDRSPQLPLQLLCLPPAIVLLCSAISANAAAAALPCCCLVLSVPWVGMPTTSVAPLECSCGPRYPGSSGEGRDLGHLVRVRLIHRARLLFCQVLGPLIGVQVPEEKVERNRNSMVLALQPWL